MKNQILFLFLMLFTIACSKSDQPTLTLQEQVTGEWQIHSFVINSCPLAEDNLPFTVSNEDGCIDIMGDTSCMSILVLENGKAEVRDGQVSGMEDVQIMTYELDEIKSTITICHELEDCIIFSLRGEGLFTDMDEEGCICTIGFVKM